MTDFADCSNRLQEAVLKSLVNRDSTIVTPDGDYGLRTVQVTKDETATTYNCGTESEFWDYFYRALGIGDDGRIVLRLVITAKANGVGLVEVPSCGTNETIWQMLGLCFCTDTNGEIALQLWNIT